MAPRQLRLEPIEVDSTADKGAKRVRVDSTEESSTQMVPSSSDPFLPTAAELAGDDPAVRPMDTSASETQVSTRFRTSHATMCPYLNRLRV